MSLFSFLPAIFASYLGGNYTKQKSSYLGGNYLGTKMSLGSYLGGNYKKMIF